MTYEHIPKTMFQKFVDQVTLDHALCESVKIPDPKKEDQNQQILEVEINVKNQNQNTGGYSSSAKNINEIFKFTCQRYHSYISQVVEFLKNKER